MKIWFMCCFLENYFSIEFFVWIRSKDMIQYWTVYFCCIFLFIFKLTRFEKKISLARNETFPKYITVIIVQFFPTIMANIFIFRSKMCACVKWVIKLSKWILCRRVMRRGQNKFYSILFHIYSSNQSNQTKQMP